MPPDSPQLVELVITAKGLDSDEVSETVKRVQGPRSEAELRTQLVTVVRSLYPEAELRSCAGEAASFLAPKLVIVAVYRTHDNQEDARTGEDDSQQQLFPG